ncbi:hypothetical protein HDU82_005795 [Entophlyctis luteolus]|nr:hypothetical protein HDU82_005795 [Entophlyctis luteolus]KAJ3383165.1 hypothetical protein HDU84_003791 [Entophlyctis sp. JEL0112]
MSGSTAAHNTVTRTHAATTKATDAANTAPTALPTTATDPELRRDDGKLVVEADASVLIVVCTTTPLNVEVLPTTPADDDDEAVVAVEEVDVVVVVVAGAVTVVEAAAVVVVPEEMTSAVVDKVVTVVPAADEVAEVTTAPLNNWTAGRAPLGSTLDAWHWPTENSPWAL